MKQYKVKADRETGEWLEEPQREGEVDMATWSKNQDTEDVHYDTFEKDDETCAICVIFVS